MAQGTCSIEGCEKPRIARGWCSMHYQRWWATADPLALRQPTVICSIEGCESPHRSRGWCGMHYARWRTHGDPLALGWRYTPPESIWLRTKPDGACVVWTGGTNELGYGQVSWKGKMVSAHRLAFYLRLGRWPDGILRHLCNNPPCVLHVVEGTNSENTLDSVAAGTHNQARKTHCKQGHPYDQANTIRRKDGGRGCRACKSEWNRQQYEKRKKVT